MNAEYWIKRLNLEPHPEGGYYRRIYESPTLVPPQNQSLCSAIYYLLEGNDYSCFHRLTFTEAWFHHHGDPLCIHTIDKEGQYSQTELSLEPTGRLSVFIEPGIWFAAELPRKSGYTLISCVVAPAFYFSGFEMGDRATLIHSYPDHKEVIGRLTR